MARRYPVSLLVFGILNLLLGAVSLVANFFWACGVGGAYVLLRKVYQEVPPAEQSQLDELWAVARNNIPGLVIIAFVLDPILFFMLGCLQIFAGGGMIAIRNWARWLCVAWAALRIFAVIVILFYDIAFFYPGIDKFARDMDVWQDRQAERMRRAGQVPPQQQRVSANLSGNIFLDNLVPITTKIISLLYAAVVLAWMVLPTTGAAIHRYRYPDDEPPPTRQGDDYYDENYARQRRALDEPRGD